MKADSRRLGDAGLGGKYTPQKGESFMNKTLGDSNTFLTRKFVSDESGLKADISDLRKQLDMANKKNS